MGMHLIPLAAFHLSRGGGGVATPRFLATLIWPYLLKLCLSLKLSPQDLITSSRFLIFQLSQILVHDDDHHRHNQHRHHHEDDDGGDVRDGDDDRTTTTIANDNRNNRWDRALRLVRERVAQAREVGRHFPPNDEESLHLLSMLSL